MDMGKGIELAKVKVEKEYETKKNAGGTKIPRPAWGMSPDEISKLIDRLEHYEGKALNMKKAQKMVRLSELAKWLLDNSMDVVAIDVERIHPSHEADKLVSRLEMRQDQGPLHGYPNYIYMLIMVLSGEGQVDLVGYRDE